MTSEVKLIGVFDSYEALGLLSSIPLASSSRGGKGKGVAGEDEDLTDSLITGYGQIVRDEDGNVIDIILPDEKEEEEEDEEESRVGKKVEAKTAIAKSTFAFAIYLGGKRKILADLTHLSHSRTGSDIGSNEQTCHSPHF